jgi:hypothetical protein
MEKSLILTGSCRSTENTVQKWLIDSRYTSLSSIIGKITKTKARGTEYS